MTKSDDDISSAPQAREQSPWLTTREAADYSRRHKDTVLRGCRQFETTQGREGLKSISRGVNAARRIHVDDLVSWMAGEKPSRGTRRPRAA